MWYCDKVDTVRVFSIPTMKLTKQFVSFWADVYISILTIDILYIWQVWNIADKTLFNQSINRAYFVQWCRQISLVAEQQMGLVSIVMLMIFGIVLAFTLLCR